MTANAPTDCVAIKVSKFTANENEKLSEMENKRIEEELNILNDIFQYNEKSEQSTALLPLSVQKSHILNFLRK